ncbi:MAG: YaiI/YqxD family protein [Oligoflexales bacterium]|nr:YaiI/YqxD family protein [Oligoflexales bacterium]
MDSPNAKNGFRIWIDADACPIPAKEIVYRYAFKWNIEVILVANNHQKIPKFHCIKLIVVPKGLDVADHYICQNVAADDIVITADIPLASDLIKEKAHVITPKGEALDTRNISERLSVRNFFDHLRSSGQHHSRSASYDNGHKKAFAASIDRLVTRLRQAQQRRDKV